MQGLEKKKFADRLPVNVWRYRELVRAVTRREIQGKYRGSWLGALWSLLIPLSLLAIYTFVFGVIFKARWPSSDGVDQNFAALLFCGIIIHGLLAEVLTRSPRLVVENANYVKRVVFPLDILSWTITFSALFHFGISLAVLLAFTLIWGDGLFWTILLVPLILLPLILFLVGLSWLLGAMGVYLRDLQYVCSFLATALIFLSPVFYPMSAVPDGFAMAMRINPLTFYIDAMRDLIVLGQLPELSACVTAAALSVAMFIFGFWFFRRVRHGFADVL